MKRACFILICLVILNLSATETFASNAGIVRGLWYDREQFFTGQSVRIYVAIRNNTGADLSGTVEFFVNDRQIERKNIEALDGRLIESWADWTPSFGTSSISATLSRTEISSTASGTRAIEVVSALAEDVIFVDSDTDKDGIGDLLDEDDDNDGLSDVEEVEAGTDPLSYDEQEVSEEDEDEDKETEDEEAEATDGGEAAVSRPEPTGLEEYLTPSPANTAFTQFTDFINTSKKKVDEYRNERDTQIHTSSTSPSIKVNDDGFGEILRTSSAEKDEPEVEKQGDWLGEIFSVIRAVSSAVFSVLLGATSFLLGYPMLLQIALLLLILYVLYRIAKHFGSRHK